MKTDLILLHPPSIVDFRRRKDVILPDFFNIHASMVFESLPVGFYSLKSYLEQRGYSVKIHNLAWMMLEDWDFSLRGFISLLDARIFGIDLHWVVHAQGALELARRIKKMHPDVPIVMGGISASYFYRELINYPQVDLVLRGNLTYQPLEKLLARVLRGRPEYPSVPNLCFKHRGRPVINKPRFYPQSSLFPVSWDFKEAHNKKINNVLFCPHSGCRYNCVFCAGSGYTSQRHGLQKKPLLFKGAKYIRQELSSVSSIGKNAEGNSPEKLLVISQWHDAGALSQAILQKIKSMKIFPTVHFPSYGLISIRMIRQIVKSTAAVIEISVQSHDLRIRRAAKCAGYTNSQLERWLEAALRHNIKRVELYFTIGLPYQNEKSVRDTVSYCLRLLKKFRHDKRVVPFIMPILFLDPGSPAFDNPEKYGYRLFARTLGDHINNFTQVDFRDRLNYETRWLSRGRIVDLNFYAIKQITRAKIYYGYLGKGAGGSALERIEQTQDLLTQLARLKGCGVSKKSQEKIFRKVGRYNREGLRSRMPEHKFFYNFWYQI